MCSSHYLSGVYFVPSTGEKVEKKTNQTNKQALMEITFGFPGVGPITPWQLGKGRDSDSMISILMYYPLPHGDYTAWWSRLNRNPRGRNCLTYTLASHNSNWSQPSFSKNPHPLPPSPFLYTAARRPFHYVLYPTIQRIWISDTFTIWCKASLLWPFPVPTPPFKLGPQGNPNSAVPRGIRLSLATRTSQMLFSKPVGLIIDRRGIPLVLVFLLEDFAYDTGSSLKQGPESYLPSYLQLFPREYASASHISSELNSINNPHS